MPDFPIQIIDRAGSRVEIASSIRVGAKSKLGTVVITDLSAVPTGSNPVDTFDNAVGLTIECKNPYDSMDVSNADGEKVKIHEDTFYMEYGDSLITFFT